MKFFVFLLLFINFQLSAHAQINCEPDTAKPSFDVIFGGDSPFDTLYSAGKIRIFFVCKDCALQAIDEKNNTIWLTALSPYGCELNSLREVYYIGRIKRLRGFDTTISFNNRSSYMLNSKTGKIKAFSRFYVWRIDRKIYRQSHGPKKRK